MNSLFLSNIQKLRKKRETERKLKQVDVIICIIGYSGIILQAWESDRYYFSNYSEDFVCTILRIFLSITSLLLTCLIIK